MKAIYLILIAIALTSCKKQQRLEANKEKLVTIDSMKVEFEKQKVIDSMKLEMAKAQEEKTETQKVVVVHEPGHNTTTTTVVEKKRKGWSSTAKGAVIGAGVGAITGAAISKKKGEGAIIGGLAGAGVGAGTGAIIDSQAKKNE